MHVVVVGSGIVGAATAYELAQRGVEVTVYEKSHVGAGSTGAGGGIRSQFSLPANVALSRASMDAWNTFEEEFDVEIRERITGYLFLARDPDTATQLERDVAMQSEYGFPNEFLSAGEATEHCPGLDPGPYVSASFSPEDRFVDPNLALRGYVDAARAAGVEFELGVAVTGVRRDGRSSGGPVTAIETADSTVDCDYVVNAAGAWASELDALVDGELPVEPRLRHQLLVRPSGSFPPDLPLTMDLDTGAVFYPEDDTVMIASGPQETMPTVDPDGYTEGASRDWTLAVLESLAELADYFDEDTRVQRSISGVYAQTPDSNPIIDEPVPGYVTAVGFSGHGFMHAPATGKVVSEIIVNGEPKLLDVTSFSARRFSDDGSSTERSFI
ncbi:FAD-dependent oxidoreductase [Halobacteriales archaeon QS_4_66_20]|nr:MAG: FAD-dependent oxidoreductase [Halobacteriales archaeon QS_4_66_20]